MNKGIISVAVIMPFSMSQRHISLAVDRGRDPTPSRVREERADRQTTPYVIYDYHLFSVHVFVFVRNDQNFLVVQVS